MHKTPHLSRTLLRAPACRGRFAPLLGLLLASGCSLFGLGGKPSAVSAQVLAAGEVIGTIPLQGDKASGITYYLVKTPFGYVIEYEGTIAFSTDSATLEGDETHAVLEGFRQILDQNPALKLRVEGHTDSRASDDYNEKLSVRRAESIRTWLVQRGANAPRLTSVGKGEREPRIREPADCKEGARGSSDMCEMIWAVNRRASLFVLEGVESLDLDTSSATGAGRISGIDVPPAKAKCSAVCPEAVAFRHDTDPSASGCQDPCAPGSSCKEWQAGLACVCTIYEQQSCDPS